MVFRAKVVRIADGKYYVQIPQVHADQQVPLYMLVSPTYPEVNDFGVVSFLDDDAAYPVWMGSVL